MLQYYNILLPDAEDDIVVELRVYGYYSCTSNTETKQIKNVRFSLPTITSITCIDYNMYYIIIILMYVFYYFYFLCLMKKKKNASNFNIEVGF